MRDIAARICRDYLTGAWKTIPAEELQLKRISGGLSNFLYYVSLPDSLGSGQASPKGSYPSTTSSKRPRKDSYTNMLEPKEVLLRIYGQTHGEHALETMLTESVVFTLLSERKLGPKLHGIFPGGRIEQYIPARPLQTTELSDEKISLKIAGKMAAIHSLDIPVSKEPDWLWNTMNRWLKSVDSTLETFKKDRVNGNKRIEGDDILTELDLRAEVEWLRSVVDKEDHPVVFSHNDLQEGNILLRQDYSPASPTMDSYWKRSRDENIDHELDNTRDSVLSGNSQTLSEQQSDGEPELMIIDFEYCAYNYRGFDLANHFLEWTFDYTNPEAPYFYHRSNQYPSQEQQEKFIAAYLTSSMCDDTGLEPSPEDIAGLRREVQCFTLASHLFWSLWGIVNIYQEIEFGYWEYAVCRLNQYILCKKRYSELVSNSGNLPDTDRET